MAARRKSRKTKQKPSKLTILIAFLLVLILLVLLICLVRISKNPPQFSLPGKPTPTNTNIPRPPGCPIVQYIAIPGTWESTVDDDPHHPSFRKNAMLLNVTQVLSSKFNAQDVDIYTQPYVAQISNPVSFPPDRQASYNFSRHQGQSRVLTEMHALNERCPNVKFILAGFSQGAVIAGDIANLIGHAGESIRSEQVLGVFLLADGRRRREQVTNIGDSPAGVGIEVKFAGFPLPGINLLGSRDGGMGDLQERTFSICAPGDMICDCSLSTSDIPHSLTAIIGVLTGGNHIHSAYNTTKYWSYNGKSAVEWIAEKSDELISTSLN